MATAQQLLTLVEDAIASLVSGAVEEYRVGDRSFRYVDLSELRSFRTELQTEVRRASGGVRLQAPRFLR